MIPWHDPQTPVLVTPGRFYRTRGGKTAFIERMHKLAWSYNGEPKTYAIWLGYVVDDGKPWSWEFWGTVSPPVYRHFPGVGFVAVQDDLDLIDEIRD